MKQSEVKHILDNTSVIEEKELVFTNTIARDNGVKTIRLIEGWYTKPSEWDHVKHITGNLYYGYDNGREAGGVVYLGEYK